MSPPDGTQDPWHPVTEAPPGWEEPKPLRANWFGTLDEVRRGRRSFDVRRPSHWIAGIAVGVVLGLIVLNLAMQAYFVVIDEPQEQAIDSGGLVAALIVNMIVFIGAPVLWVAVMYYGGASAVRDRLLLRSHSVGHDLLIGFGAALLGLIVSFLMVWLFTLLGWETENPVVEDLGPQLTWSLVLFIPFAAATSEEVFFRGFLHPRIGIVPANVLFGLVHLSYQTPLQVIVPMILGFVLSLTLVRRRSLLPAVVAHFLFNFVALTFTKLSSDFGWNETMGIFLLQLP